MDGWMVMMVMMDIKNQSKQICCFGVRTHKLQEGTAEKHYFWDETLKIVRRKKIEI